MTESTPTLADGSVPLPPRELLRRLDALGIDASTVDHPPVFTVDEASTVRGVVTGAHTKNLFLRNKKGAMWLVACPAERSVDLKALAARLSAGRFSFGSADRLMRFLGVVPGSVTPFAVVNDTGHQVRVVLDRQLLGEATVNFHPLVNTKTTSLRPSDLVRFLESEDHAPEIIDLR